MARRYAVTGTRTVATSAKTMLGLTGATTIRPQIADVIFGASGTPADNALNWIMQRYTAAGTSTAVTPIATDPADPAALAAGTTTHTVEPTYTAGAILLDIDLNQRATHRWVANPGYELKIPATANNGLGLATLHASYSGAVDGTFLYEE